KVGERIILPFFSGIINRSAQPLKPGKPYYIEFQNFDNVVNSYKLISVAPENNNSSVLKLALTGDNKAQIVDYLNGSVAVLSENMLKRKNLFATKTIRFIDSSLTVKSRELQLVEDELNQFRNRNNTLNISAESSEISSKLSSLDL